MLVNQTSDNPATPNTVERDPLYFLSDVQGTTRALTTTTGAIEQSYSYDAFGNLTTTIATNAFKTDYLYTGQQYDPATELYSLRARYYDPSVGRFMSRDTWAYNYGNPVELNRYVYAAGNPTRYRDPSGHQGVREYAALALITAVVASTAILLCLNYCHPSAMSTRAVNDFTRSMGEGFDALVKALTDPLFWQGLADAYVENAGYCTISGCWTHENAPSHTSTEATIRSQMSNVSDEQLRYIVTESERIIREAGDFDIALTLGGFMLDFVPAVESIINYSKPVLAYPQWHDRLGTPEIVYRAPNERRPRNFGWIFPVVAIAADEIHFNVAGILNSQDFPVQTPDVYTVASYDDYIQRHGSSGMFLDSADYTADELYWIKNVFCYKTTFYNTTDGVTFYVDTNAYSEICR
jgi:RHS repeat-associated protein